MLEDEACCETTGMLEDEACWETIGMLEAEALLETALCDTTELET